MDCNLITKSKYTNKKYRHNTITENYITLYIVHNFFEAVFVMGEV